jgi:CBS domain-containing protein
VFLRTIGPVPIADAMTVRVVSVSPDETVGVAIARMLEENVGAVVVSEGQELRGIFTERDVLRLAGGGSDFHDLKVAEVMTRGVTTVTADVDVKEAAKLMRDRRIRHLPVVEGANVLGMVGIRDVMGALVERLWQTHDEAARDTARDLLRRGGT